MKQASNITLRVDKEMYDMITEYANQYYGGNRSLLIKEAVRAFILKIDDDQTEMNEKLDELRKYVDDKFELIEKDMMEMKIMIQKFIQIMGGRGST